MTDLTTEITKQSEILILITEKLKKISTQIEISHLLSLCIVCLLLYLKNARSNFDDSNVELFANSLEASNFRLFIFICCLLQTSFNFFLLYRFDLLVKEGKVIHHELIDELEPYFRAAFEGNFSNESNNFLLRTKIILRSFLSSSEVAQIHLPTFIFPKTLVSITSSLEMHYFLDFSYIFITFNILS